MTLRLNGSTSGYSEIDAPAIAGDQVFTLPTTGGTLDRINRAGNILQVVSATYSVNTSTASATYIDSGLSASITPLSNSNKVLVLVNHASCYKTGSDTFLLFQLLRGSTSLVEFERYGGYTASVATVGIGSCSTAYLDSPATTSSTTYKTQLRSSSGTTGAGFGANNAVSTITLIEVAA